MAKKPDMARVKEFFFKYGERVALIAIACIAVLLVAMGLSGATGPGTPNGEPWDKSLDKAAKTVQVRANTDGEPDKTKIEKEAQDKATDLERQPFDSKVGMGQYISIPETPDFKRRLPMILGVLEGDNNFQMDYVFRGFIGYEVLKDKVLAHAADAGSAAAGAPAGIKPPAAIMPPVGAGAGAGAGGGPTLAQVLKPRTALVVTGIFPMKKQVEEFIKALRLERVEDLFANRELPHIAGINVVRNETGPDGKATVTNLILYDPKTKKLEVNRALEEAMREGIYDEANPRAMAVVIHPGLVTPLPQIPEGLNYPKLNIQGPNWPDPKNLIVADNNPTPGAPGVANPPAAPIMPGAAGTSGAASIMQKMKSAGKAPGMPGVMPPGNMMPGQPGGGQPGAAAVEAKLELIPIKQLEDRGRKDLADRLRGKYNIFHPQGLFTDEKPDAKAEGAPGSQNALAAAQGGIPLGFDAVEGAPAPAAPGGGGVSGAAAIMAKMMGKGVGAQPQTPTASGSAPKLFDAIIRFVDVDVKPGYTYTYAIQVRMNNPNFGKKTEVVQQHWSEIKELPSPWTVTRSFTVPGTYHLFAVDQFLVDALGEKDGKKAKAKFSELFRVSGPMHDNQHATVQLHRWFGQSGDHLIGDWAIAERLVVRKGEPIGSSEMIVEIPTWNKGKNGFEMLSSIPPALKAGKSTKAAAPQPGVPLDFRPPITFPDPKLPDPIPPMLVDFEGGKKTNLKLGVSNEEAATELLILTPDGKLVVHNSRADVDAVIKEGSDNDVTRQKRVETWRERNNAVLEAGSGPAAPPGVGTPPPIGPPGGKSGGAGGS
jgi:hypothetical protein